MALKLALQNNRLIKVNCEDPAINHNLKMNCSTALKKPVCTAGGDKLS